jgi:acetylornithine deacetylase/succinyl-diaminopimelate desuccinylase-like protein
MYDMKSLTVAQLLATIDAARAGRKPKRSILFLQTSSEEEGSWTGTHWILDQHPELTARFGTVLTEGGVVEAISPTDVKYWGIEFGQKQFAVTTLCSPDRQALERLKGLLERTGRGEPRLELDPGVRAFLAAYAPTRGSGRLTELLAAPDRLPRERDRFDELTPFLKALFRDEVQPLGVHELAGGGYGLDVWIHALPGADLEAVAAELFAPWKTHGLGATPLARRGSGRASPIDHPDFRALEAAVGARFPGVPVGPYFLPWALTDAALFREAGFPAYGFSPFPVVVFDTTQIAKANERMQLPAFREGVALYRETVRRLVD